MVRGSVGPAGRAALLLLGAGLVARTTVPRLGHVPAAADFDALLCYGAACVLTGVAGWTAVVATALLLSSRPPTAVAGRRLLAASCPRRWRTPLLLALGAASVATVASPAHAEGWRPPALDRPVDTVGTSRAAARPAPAQWVRVAAGDSLWSLARQRLPGSDDATLARLVRRTYAANRSVIGPDPNLLHPGEQLRVPGPRSAR